MGCTPSRPVREASSRFSPFKYIVPTKSFVGDSGIESTYESIAADSWVAKRSRRELFSEEKNFIAEHNSHAFEAFGQLFKKLLLETQDGRFGINYVLSKEQLKNALDKELNVKLPTRIFDKLFEFFDFRNEGYVDKVEFAVACGLLTFHGTYQSATQVAFRIFDTNHDGVLSKREFCEMAIVLMGYRLRTLFSMKAGKLAFHRFLQSEYNDELLMFYNEFNAETERSYPRESRRSIRLRDSTSELMSLEKAQQLYEQYIAVGAVNEINISQELRLQIEAGLSRVQGHVASVRLFEPALYEIYQLMENDCMVRFKRRISQEPHVFSDTIWEVMEINAPVMTFEEFEQYSFETPNLFYFIDNLYESLYKEVNIEIDVKAGLPAHLRPRFESYTAEEGT